MSELLSFEQKQGIAVDLSMRLGPNDKLIDVAGEVVNRLVHGEPMSLADRALLGICSVVTQNFISMIGLGTVEFKTYDDKLKRWEDDVRAQVDKLLIEST